MPCAPGLLAPLLGLALGLTLSLTGAGAAADCGSLGPAERLAFSSEARARWLAPRVRAPGPLDVLYSSARGFLDIVQRNPFPTELVKLMLNKPESVKEDEVLRYQAGYVACAAIAILYLLAMPCVGLCFWCCRCRRHCGGRVKSEHKALARERGALGTFLLLTTLVLLVGVACAFATNQRVHQHTGPSLEAVPETLLSLRGLVSDVPQELQAVAEQFSLPQKRILEDLDGIGLNIGTTIHAQLRSTVEQTLTSVQNVGQALQVSVDHLRVLNTTLEELRQGQRVLKPAVQEFKEQLLTLLQEPHCQGCEGAVNQAQALELGADFNQVPTVDDALHRLQGVPKANFSAMVEEENSTFNTLPLLTALHMTDRVQELKKVVKEQPEGLNFLAEGFPGWDASTRWSQALEDVEQRSRPYLKEVERYERYRWILGWLLCSVVLLVVMCNLLGLSLGIWGLSAREDPSHVEARGEAGARFLLVGVGLSFFFAAPLILLVLITFLVGGNVQTLLCRSWESGELYEFADTPGNLPPSMNLTHLLGLKKNISILLAYEQCREGAALWKVLQLNDSYDLEKHLDISQYTTTLKQDLQKLKLDSQNLDVLSPDARQDLKALHDSGIEKIQYPHFHGQLQKPVVNTDVVKLAQELDRLAQAQRDRDLQEQLRKKAQGLRHLHQQKVLPQQSLMVKLNLSVTALEFSAPLLQEKAAQVLDMATHLSKELPSWTNQIVKSESECFLDREASYLSQYLDWVREEVTQHIATCQPLSGALDNGRVIVCDMLAAPWNAFWFCLAWCTFFLIPSIIFAVKTSKYFRPIRKRLSSTSSEETQLFRIPRVTSLKL